MQRTTEAVLAEIERVQRINESIVYHDVLNKITGCQGIIINAIGDEFFGQQKLTTEEINALNTYLGAFKKYEKYYTNNAQAVRAFSAIQKKLSRCEPGKNARLDLNSPYGLYKFNQIVEHEIDFDSGIYKYKVLLDALHWAAVAMAISGIVILCLHMSLSLGIPLLVTAFVVGTLVNMDFARDLVTYGPPTESKGYLKQLTTDPKNRVNFFSSPPRIPPTHQTTMLENNNSLTPKGFGNP